MAEPKKTQFAELYARLLPPVRAKCRRLLGRNAIADEIAQEALTRLWQSGPPLDTSEPRTLMAWLYVTSTRLATDALREGRHLSTGDPVVEPMACGASPADVAAAREAIVALARTVPADEIQAAVLTRVDGLPQEEAAQLLGVSERTIRRLLERFDERSVRLREEVAR
jgi:RNA polymerase sigma-70 factor (ECF subfamily)